MRPLSLKLILCVGFAILFCTIVLSILNQSINAFDNAVINLVQGMESPWLTAMMKLLTWIGSSYTVALLGLLLFSLLFFIWKRRQQAILLPIVIGGTVLLHRLLRFYFQRERPEIHRITDAEGFSFPSGHTMNAFSFFVIIVYIAWHSVKTAWSRFLLIAFATFMIFITGMSRIYLGVHYPSDVLGGIAASGFCVTLILIFHGIYQNRQDRKEV